MKIILTGSNGFLGSNLIKLNPKIKFIPYDRNNPVLPKNFDGIIHTAGLAHNSHDNRLKEFYMNSNFVLTKNIFNNFKKNNGKFFIFISTSTIYEGLNSCKKLINEDQFGNNMSIYAKSKFLAEKYLLSEKNNCKVFILRPSLIVSKNPKGNLKLLSRFIKNNLPVPIPFSSKKRNLTDIRNINFVISKILENFNNYPSGIYNLCDNKSLNFKEIIVKLSLEMNKNPKYIYLPFSIFKSLLKFNFFKKNKILKKINSLFFNECLMETKKIKDLIDCNLPYNSFE